RDVPTSPAGGRGEEPWATNSIPHPEPDSRRSCEPCRRMATNTEFSAILRHGRLCARLRMRTEEGPRALRALGLSRRRERRFSSPLLFPLLEAVGMRRIDAEDFHFRRE